MSFHKYSKSVIDESWKYDQEPTSVKRIVMNSDWKENVKRGRAPVEDANAIHQVIPTAVYGSLVRYFHPDYQKAGRINVLVFTDVLDKTGVAAVTLEKFIHKRLMENQWYRDVYERAKTVKKWFDVGRHFYCEEFLGHELLVNLKETKKHQWSPWQDRR